MFISTRTSNCSVHWIVRKWKIIGNKFKIKSEIENKERREESCKGKKIKIWGVVKIMAYMENAFEGECSFFCNL